jgi:hypothetical protein
VLFGSDFPFAPTAAGQYFVNGLERSADAETTAEIDRVNAARLFPRFATQPAPAIPTSTWEAARSAAQRVAARLVFTLVQPRP